MAREFKPLRFFLLMAIAVFIGAGVTSFYTHRAAQGRTPDERAGYAVGVQASASAQKLPTAAELNMLAQEYFQKQGSGNKQDWDLGFERGYEDGFKKTHPR